MNGRKSTQDEIQKPMEMVKYQKSFAVLYEDEERAHVLYDSHTYGKAYTFAKSEANKSQTTLLIRDNKTYTHYFVSPDSWIMHSKVPDRNPPKGWRQRKFWKELRKNGWKEEPISSGKWSYYKFQKESVDAMIVYKRRDYIHIYSRTTGECLEENWEWEIANRFKDYK